MRIAQTFRLFGVTLFLALLCLSGCGHNPNDVYLQQAEPSVGGLVMTWRDLNMAPDASACDEIASRLDKIGSHLASLEVPEGSADFHSLMLESQKLQSEDVIVKKQIALLMAENENSKMTEEERSKQLAPLREKTTKTTETMRELSKKIQSAFEKF